MSTAAKRLLHEVEILHEEDPATGIGGGPQGDDPFQWDAFIIGPAGTPWEGGKFQLRFSFPPNYPFGAPVVRFVWRMFHPNIYPDGSICVNFLEEWSPLMNTRLVLLSLQLLLNSPNVESPANPEAAQLFCTNRRDYNRRVRAIVEDCSTISRDVTQSSVEKVLQWVGRCKNFSLSRWIYSVDFQEDWPPYMTPRLVLISHQSLLDSPNIESPANPEAAQLFCTNRRDYNRQVRAIAEDCSTI